MQAANVSITHGHLHQIAVLTSFSGEFEGWPGGGYASILCEFIKWYPLPRVSHWNRPLMTLRDAICVVHNNVLQSFREYSALHSTSVPALCTKDWLKQRYLLIVTVHCF